MFAGTETLALSSASGVQRHNSNKLDGGKTSTEAPRLSPHLGSQGLPGLDILNAYKKYILSIYKVHRNTYNIIMLYTLITSERVYSNEIQINNAEAVETGTIQVPRV